MIIREIILYFLSPVLFKINFTKKDKYKINKKNNVLSEISKHDIVVGCNTVALYLAILGKKKVYTSIPKGYFCNIPSKKIKYLNQI